MITSISQPPMKIEQMEAGPTITNTGKAVKEGSRVQRLKLSSTNDSLNVAVKVFTSLGLWERFTINVLKLSGKYVEIKSGEEGKRVLLNVTSVVTRLHLTEDTIRLNSGDPDFVSTLAEQVKTITKNPWISCCQQVLRELRIIVMTQIGYNNYTGIKNNIHSDTLEEIPKQIQKALDRAEKFDKAKKAAKSVSEIMKLQRQQKQLDDNHDTSIGLTVKIKEGITGSVSQSYRSRLNVINQQSAGLPNKYIVIERPKVRAEFA